MKRHIRPKTTRNSSRIRICPSVESLEARTLLAAIQLGDFGAVVYSNADSVYNNTPDPPGETYPFIHYPGLGLTAERRQADSGGVQAIGDSKLDHLAIDPVWRLSTSTRATGDNGTAIGQAWFYDTLTVGAGSSGLPFGTEVPLYLVVQASGTLTNPGFDGNRFLDRYQAGAYVDRFLPDGSSQRQWAGGFVGGFLNIYSVAGTNHYNRVLDLGMATVGERVIVFSDVESDANTPNPSDVRGSSITASFHVATSVLGIGLTAASGWANTSDVDGDGLLDPWEAGFAFDGNIHDGNTTTPDFKLIDPNGGPAPNPFAKDLFVEADAMADSTQSRAPAPGVLDQVVAAFAAAPVANMPNADGSPTPSGIALHVKLDEKDLPLASWGATPWNDFNAVKADHFGTKVERDAPNSAAVLGAKRLAYRYAIFADSRADGFSGEAEIGGNDFMINIDAGFFLQAQNSAIQFPGFTFAQELADLQAATFMHELGHTLGLRHGGADDTNGKPNYISVMNYSRQFNDSGPASGIPGIPDGTTIRLSRRIDYSSQLLAPLNETNLNETVGINGPPGVLIEYGDNAGNNHIGPTNGPINWNGDTNPDGTPRIQDAAHLVASDIDHSPVIGGTSATPSPGEQNLASYDDWANLKYGFRDSADFADGVHSTSLDDPEPTAEDYRLAVIGDPGIMVTNTTGLVTTQDGGTATFNVALRTRPTADVTIDLASDNPSQGHASPVRLTFTPDNWALAQTVTVTGAAGSGSGDITYRVVTAAAVSTDSHYSGLNASDVLLTNHHDGTVSPSTTTTTLTATPNPSILGHTVTFTVIVSAGNTSTPTGKVTFLVDGHAQPPVSLRAVNGKATARFSLDNLEIGTHSISASYSGAALFARSQTAAVLPQVVKRPTVPRPSGFGAGRDAFVTTLYVEILNRQPEPSGLRFWSGLLTAKVNTRTVAGAIWRAPEHRALVRQHKAPSIGFKQAFTDALLASRQAKG
jgi:hypothetical protein